MLLYPGSVKQLRGKGFDSSLFKVFLLILDKDTLGAFEIKIYSIRIVQNGRRDARNAIFGLDSNMVCCYCVDNFCGCFSTCGALHSSVKPCK